MRYVVSFASWNKPEILTRGGVAMGYDGYDPSTSDIDYVVHTEATAQEGPDGEVRQLWIVSLFLAEEVDERA